eukprot:TRINITY_DN7054_c0_g1_i5.p1 TRINITY_DN7054_c0_g1~~TRINITY_DN7054_c0_g1_i5.p1  ORF type:complete len:718 (+),score=186.16 TRINITY_DN7054_c0_g1_i5:227-2380(+)
MQRALFLMIVGLACVVNGSTTVNPFDVLPSPQRSVMGHPDNTWRCYFPNNYNDLLPDTADRTAQQAQLAHDTLKGLTTKLNTSMNWDLVQEYSVIDNGGRGTIMEFVISNATIVSSWKVWMAKNGNFTVEFNGQSLTALAASAAPPVDPPNSDSGNDGTTGIIVGVIAALVLVAVVIVMLNNGQLPNKRAKRQLQPAFTAVPSQVTSKGMTELHMAVMQQDIDQVRSLTVPPLSSDTLSNHDGLSAPEDTDISSQPSPMMTGADTPLTNVTQVSSPVNTGAEAFSALANIAVGQGVDASLLPDVMVTDVTPIEDPTMEAFAADSSRSSSAASQPYHQVNLNARDGAGWTPLAWACNLDNRELAQVLLDSGADANIPNDKHQAPLHIAILNSQSNALLDTLLQYKPNVNVMDLEQNTPLIHAARQSNMHAVQALLTAGADASLTDNRGMTPAMHAAAQSDDASLQLLLAASQSSLNVKDINGWTLLHWGAAVGCYTCLATLLRQPGIQVTMATPRGENVFHFAAKRGDSRMIQIVCEHLATDAAQRNMPGQELDVYKLLTQAAVDDKTPLGFAQLHQQYETAIYIQTLIDSRQESAALELVAPQTTPQSSLSPLSHSSNNGSPMQGHASDTVIPIPQEPEMLTEEDFAKLSKQEAAKLKRKIRRREYMRKRRAEQKHEIEYMDDKVKELQAQNAELEAACRALREESHQLRHVLAANA